MYDYIFAGGGCAGLSLLYRINQNPALENKKILIIDQQNAKTNDRTWCAWLKEPTPFDAIACKTWNYIRFQTHQLNARLSIAPYRYQMIRGIDFYNFVQNSLKQNPNIVWLDAKITQITNSNKGAKVEANGQIYEAQWVFDSLPPRLQTDNPKYHYWYQHFKGWFVKTKQPVFEADTATFMDFRIEQKGEARFVYTLPTSSTEALVEFTVFGGKVLPQEEYETALDDYFTQKLWLQSQDYEIVDTEFGIIPMTSQPLHSHSGGFVIKIGTAGGQTRASTGFTFANIQRHSKALYEAIATTGQPILPKKFDKTWYYDSILLNVMAHKRMEARDVFEVMFKNHEPARVLAFLDGETSFIEELKIMASVPMLPFVKGGVSILAKQWKIS